MAFNKHECDWRRVGAQRQTDGLQEADELENFKEELLRAIAPLEYRMSPKAGAPSSRPTPFQASKQQGTFKSKLFVLGAMTAIVGGVLIGVTLAAADMEHVTLAD